MAEFRWIVTSSFLMLQVLICRAASEKYSSFTVRDGDEVTLPSGNVIHDKCDTTTWLFTDSGITVTVFDYGKIHKEAEAKSDRLSVSEDCSLVIKNVTDEDAGRYICRRFRSGRQEGGYAVSDLYVVTMTEQKNNDEVTFNCSVAIYEGCEHKVKWMYESNQSDVMTSQRCCAARWRIDKSHLDQKPNSYELLKCEVTHGAQVYKFPFWPPQSSGDDETTTTSDQAWCRLCRSIFVSLGLAALIITVVTVAIWIRTKENKTRTPEIIERHEEEEEEEEEEVEGTVDYDNVGEPSASVSLD